MSGHFPFSGKANRVAVFAFFEDLGLSLELQERYYRWWHEWAKNFVQKDPDLSLTKAVEFSHYPFGQHAHANFHLHDYLWATPMLDLGEFIENVIFPRLDDKAMHQLGQEYEKMLEGIVQEAAQHPRPAPPEIGRYRHT
ncbi:MAG: hypothetical protein M0Z84_08770 [Gammaproteobacteria bacterium]|nr:hypothetical protein [Gammaproteobacteria bacterium]